MQGAIDSVMNRFRRRKGQGPQLTREQAMAGRPIRNPSLRWRENDDGEAVVTLPRRQDLLGKALGWVFFVPESRPLVLDEVGTFVWAQCDGTNTVSEIVKLLRVEYKLGSREAEVSLTDYLKTLGKRGMVGFLVPKEIADELGEGGKEVIGLEDVGSTEEDIRRVEREQAEAEAAESGEAEE